MGTGASVELRDENESVLTLSNYTQEKFKDVKTVKDLQEKVKRFLTHSGNVDTTGALHIYPSPTFVLGSSTVKLFKCANMYSRMQFYIHNSTLEQSIQLVEYIKQLFSHALSYNVFRLDSAVKTRRNRNMVYRYVMNMPVVVSYPDPDVLDNKIQIVYKEPNVKSDIYIRFLDHVKNIFATIMEKEINCFTTNNPVKVQISAAPMAGHLIKKILLVQFSSYDTSMPISNIQIQIQDSYEYLGTPKGYFCEVQKINNEIEYHIKGGPDFRNQDLIVNRLKKFIKDFKYNSNLNSNGDVLRVRISPVSPSTTKGDIEETCEFLKSIFWYDLSEEDDPFDQNIIFIKEFNYQAAQTPLKLPPIFSRPKK
jgi:hypothetical protein